MKNWMFRSISVGLILGATLFLAATIVGGCSKREMQDFSQLHPQKPVIATTRVVEQVSEKIDKGADRAIPIVITIQQAAEGGKALGIPWMDTLLGITTTIGVGLSLWQKRRADTHATENIKLRAAWHAEEPAGPSPAMLTVGA